MLSQTSEHLPHAAAKSGIHIPHPAPDGWLRSGLLLEQGSTGHISVLASCISPGYFGGRIRAQKTRI